MAELSLLQRRFWSIGASVLGFTMLAIYVTLILSELGNTLGSTMPWGLLMLIAALIALVSVFVADPHLARNLLLGAGVLFGLLGVVSLMTIGIGFLAAAGVSLFGASKL